MAGVPEEMKEVYSSAALVSASGPAAALLLRTSDV